MCQSIPRLFTRHLQLFTAALMVLFTAAQCTACFLQVVVKCEQVCWPWVGKKVGTVGWDYHGVNN